MDAPVSGIQQAGDLVCVPGMSYEKGRRGSDVDFGLCFSVSRHLSALQCGCGEAVKPRLYAFMRLPFSQQVSQVAAVPFSLQRRS